MKLLFSIVALMVLSTISFAQIKNSKTETLKVYGNCGMCKTKIEKAGTQKNLSKTVWNEETAMATITYDSKKTTANDILKNIALVGYDSDNFLAPDAVYENLPGCCQYERKAKPAKTAAAQSVDPGDDVFSEAYQVIDRMPNYEDESKEGIGKAGDESDILLSDEEITELKFNIKEYTKQVKKPIVKKKIVTKKVVKFTPPVIKKVH